MNFTLKNVSSYGTAYYVREGFKQAIAIPQVHFVDGKAPETLDLGGEGVEFATKAEKAKAPKLNDAIAKLDPDAKKAVRKAQREAARKAATEALAAAGVSL